MLAALPPVQLTVAIPALQPPASTLPGQPWAQPGPLAVVPPIPAVPAGLPAGHFFVSNDVHDLVQHCQALRHASACHPALVTAQEQAEADTAQLVATAELCGFGPSAAPAVLGQRVTAVEQQLGIAPGPPGFVSLASVLQQMQGTIANLNATTINTNATLANTNATLANLSAATANLDATLINTNESLAILTSNMDVRFRLFETNQSRILRNTRAHDADPLLPLARMRSAVWEGPPGARVLVHAVIEELLEHVPIADNPNRLIPANFNLSAAECNNVFNWYNVPLPNVPNVTLRRVALIQYFKGVSPHA